MTEDEPKIRRVWLTGSDGYIGAVMGPALADAGYEVTGLDAGFFRDCAFAAPPAPALTTRRGDIRDVRPADLEGCDAVVHLAALSNDPLGEIQSSWTTDINYRATIRLARAAREAGVRRFLFASSCSMYGAAREDELLTEEAPLRPVTAYAESKVRAEEELAQLADSHFSPVFLRNATAYGVSPRLRADLVLNNLTAWAYTTGQVRLLSDGAAWRPLVHVEDIARAFTGVLRAPRQVIHNEAFNIGAASENYQVRDLARVVGEVVPGATIEFAGSANADQRNYRVDFSKFQRTLPSSAPLWDVRRGAAQLWRAYREARLTEADFQTKYTRLFRLKSLLEEGRLDGDLRWTGEKRTEAGA